jgi:transcriptional regulator with XRE-family HTH domain
MRDLNALEIKLRRIALGWRQQDLAALVGMSTTRLSAIERGERKPRLDEVNSLAAVLDLSSSTEIVVSEMCLAKSDRLNADTFITSDSAPNSCEGKTVVTKI